MIDNKEYESIIPTAILNAYLRTLTNIPVLTFSGEKEHSLYHSLNL